MMLNFSNNGNKIEFEYYSTANGKHFKVSNQAIKSVPGTNSMVLKTTTEATTTAATEEVSGGGCGGAVLSTVAATSVVVTSLTAFAMRKRKENN